MLREAGIVLGGVRVSLCVCVCLSVRAKTKITTYQEFYVSCCKHVLW